MWVSALSFPSTSLRIPVVNAVLCNVSHPEGKGSSPMLISTSVRFQEDTWPTVNPLVTH